MTMIIEINSYQKYQTIDGSTNNSVVIKRKRERAFMIDTRENRSYRENTELDRLP